MRHTRHILRTIALALALIAAARTTAKAETVTYTISGSTEQNGNVNFTVTALGDATGTFSTTWTFSSTKEVNDLHLPGGIILSFGSDKTSSLAVNGYLQIEADQDDKGKIIFGTSPTKYIYHVTLKNNSGTVVHEAWNLDTSCSHHFKSIQLKTIVVEYADKIPFTDAVISGINSTYPISTTAVSPTPTVTWHGTTLTKDTHYTLSYQNNAIVGTATVTATGTGIFTSTSVSKDYTLEWATYRVRFNARGGSGTMSDQVFTYNTAQALTANAFTPPSGYQGFAGWNTKADGSGTGYTDQQEVSNLTATNGATVTLYAQWTAIPWTGSGTKEDPWKIQYPSQLDLLAQRVNTGTGDDFAFSGYNGKYFQLANDITYDNSTNNYTPIGYFKSNSEMAWFSGTFNGQGYTVSGINVTRTGSTAAADNIGLFGYVRQGTVENVVLASSTFTGYRYIGGIVGENYGGTVQNVVLANSTFTGQYYVGGIVGRNYIGTVQNCKVESNVSILSILAIDYEAEKFGGIVGENYESNAKVLGCVSAAIIKNNVNIVDCGGIVGYNYRGTIQDCLYTGTTVEANNYKGAIVGLGQGNSATFTNNYYTSAINIGGVGAEGSSSDQDGARRARTVTLGENVALAGDEIAYNVSGLTAIGTSALRTSDGTIYSGEGQTLTLATPVGCTATYCVNGTSIDGNSFTMSAADVTVSATLTPAASITITGHRHNGFYWATFYHSAFRYTLPAGAQAYTMGTDHKLYRLGDDGRVIPKNTAVVIISDEAAIELTYSDSASEVAIHGPGSKNILYGGPVTVTNGKVPVPGSDPAATGTPYVLGVTGNPATIGFHPFTGGSIPANKAYYVE